MFCMQCGSEQAEGAKFCRICGAVVTPAAALADAPTAVSQYAEIWPRAGAFLLDTIIVMLLSAVPAIIVALLVHDAAYPDHSFVTQEERENAEGWAFFAGSSVAAVVWLIYHVVGWSGGQTWAMKGLGLRLVLMEDHTQSPGVGRAVVRYLVALVGSWALYLGYLWAIWDDRRQTWHDKAAGTVVITDPPQRMG